MPSTYTPITAQTLTTATTTVTFSSIPSTFTDLVLVVSNLTTTNNSSNLYGRVGNGSADSGTNYSYTILKGSTTTVASSTRQTNSNVLNLGGYDIGTTNTVPSMSITNFMNYSSTATNKTVLSRFSIVNGGSSEINTMVQLWRSTAAINYIQVYTNGGNLLTGTTLSLYGIKAA